ncbi:MAG: two-component regulator propeller domain-containing protein, partial [Chitinophagaceae bacterium]
MYSSSLKKLITSNGRCIIIILVLLFAKYGISQVVLPDFNLVRGTKSFTLGKVNSMAQDKYGYMWFSDNSNGCLVRYDGYHTKVFRHDPNDSNSVSLTNFECIAADPSGNIWIPVSGGLDKFDFATNKFIHYRLPAGEDNFGSCMFIDRTGIIWGGGNGL